MSSIITVADHPQLPSPAVGLYPFCGNLPLERKPISI